MHVSSGRWLYGLSLAMVTAVLWGILPIKLKLVLQTMDPVTVTWYRLFSSGLVLLVWWARAASCRRFGHWGAGAACWWDSPSPGWSATTCCT